SGRHATTCRAISTTSSAATTTAAAATTAALGLGQRREIDPQLLCLHLYIEVERCRRLHAEAATTTSLRRTGPKRRGIRAELLQAVDKFLRSGRVNADALRRELDVPVELEGRRHGAGILGI